jgi:hypothetical protein
VKLGLSFDDAVGRLTCRQLHEFRKKFVLSPSRAWHRPPFGANTIARTTFNSSNNRNVICCCIDRLDLDRQCVLCTRPGAVFVLDDAVLCKLTFCRYRPFGENKRLSGDDAIAYGRICFSCSACITISINASRRAVNRYGFGSQSRVLVLPLPQSNDRVASVCREVVFDESSLIFCVCVSTPF